MYFLLHNIQLRWSCDAYTSVILALLAFSPPPHPNLLLFPSHKNSPLLLAYNYYIVPCIALYFLKCMHSSSPICTLYFLKCTRTSSPICILYFLKCTHSSSPICCCSVPQLNALGVIWYKYIYAIVNRQMYSMGWEDCRCGCPVRLISFTLKCKCPIIISSTTYWECLFSIKNKAHTKTN